MKVDLGSTITRQLLRWSGRPAAETALRCLGTFACGFVLSGFQVAGTWTPVALAMAGSLGLGLTSFSAYFGACLGYLAFFSVDGALEPMAVGLLLQACLCVFSDPQTMKKRWFLPGSLMIFTALVGVLFLVQVGISPRTLWRYGLRIALGGGAALWFLRAADPKESIPRLLSLVCLCGGLCAVELWHFPLGFIAGCAVAAKAAEGSSGLTVAVLCGLALDFSWGGGVTAPLVFGALIGRDHGKAYIDRLFWLGAVVLSGLLTGCAWQLLASAFLGAVLSLAIGELSCLGNGQALQTQSDPRTRLTANLLDRLGQCLAVTRADAPDPETNAVFDRAADRVCRLCSRWDTCWGTAVVETCDALNRAAPAMLTRGKALREDLPESFTEQCRHMEGLLNALNRELEDLGCRRQYRSRLRESRRILSMQYQALGDALSRPVRREGGRPRFQPELGFRSRGRQVGDLSGDRGASFRVDKWFFLILCDGMGTGYAAHAEAGAAIEILRILLQTGMEPAKALEMLNGIYILRDDGGFATLDLLRVDLETGQGELHKWGSAPSYLKRRGSVEKIGTASPPPGIGVGEEYRPEGVKLSLSRGEILVMVTDGAGGEAAERFIRQYGGLSPKELASGIVSCSHAQGEDDRTAAVIKLHSRLSD